MPNVFTDSIPVGFSFNSVSRLIRPDADGLVALIACVRLNTGPLTSDYMIRAYAGRVAPDGTFSSTFNQDLIAISADLTGFNRDFASLFEVVPVPGAMDRWTILYQINSANPYRVASLFWDGTTFVVSASRQIASDAPIAPTSANSYVQVTNGNLGLVLTRKSVDGVPADNANVYTNAQLGVAAGTNWGVEYGSTSPGRRQVAIGLSPEVGVALCRTTGGAVYAVYFDNFGTLLEVKNLLVSRLPAVAQVGLSDAVLMAVETVAGASPTSWQGLTSADRSLTALNNGGLDSTRNEVDFPYAAGRFAGPDQLVVGGGRGLDAPASVFTRYEFALVNPDGSLVETYAFAYQHGAAMVTTSGQNIDPSGMSGNPSIFAFTGPRQWVGYVNTTGGFRLVTNGIRIVTPAVLPNVRQVHRDDRNRTVHVSSRQRSNRAKGYWFSALRLHPA